MCGKKLDKALKKLRDGSTYIDISPYGKKNQVK